MNIIPATQQITITLGDLRHLAHLAEQDHKAMIDLFGEGHQYTQSSRRLKRGLARLASKDMATEGYRRDVTVALGPKPEALA